MDKPEPIRIIGEDKSLEAVIEGFPGSWDIIEQNSFMYRTTWKRFLPRTEADGSNNFEWSMAYQPLVTVRKAFPTEAILSGKQDVLPYFIVLLNTGRDERPKDEATPKKAPQKKDKLQINLIDRGMVIAEFEDYYLCPNGYPYHRFASLLVHKDPSRREDYSEESYRLFGEEAPTEHEKSSEIITARDLGTWMKFSMLTRQFVFFNTYKAGASILNRLHAQVVDPEGIRIEENPIIYPILNPVMTNRRKVREGVSVLEGYSVEALIFSGTDAPYQAAQVARRLQGSGMAFNVLVNSREIFVVGRNKEKETSHCIGKKVGGYEIAGVMMVGNVEEPLLEKTGLERGINGADVFNYLSFETIGRNLRFASNPVTLGMNAL